MSDAIAPSKIINQPYQIDSTFLNYVSAFMRGFLPFRGSTSPSHQSIAPLVNSKVVKLQECPEEFDDKIREAKLALRATDVGSWNSSPASTQGEINTDSDPKKIQHWSVVAHFPRGEKTYLFQAWEENGRLQAGRAECVNKEVFEKATQFGTIETSPNELLKKAQKVKKGNHYALFGNNCQTWTREFVYLISSDLLISLYNKIPETETPSGSYARQFLNESSSSKP